MVDIFHGFCVHRFGSCALQICPSHLTHRKKEDYLNKLPAVSRFEFWGWSTGGFRRGQKATNNQLKTCSTHMHTRKCTAMYWVLPACKSVKMITTWFSTTSNYGPLETFTRLGEGTIYICHMQHHIFQTHLYLKKNNIIWHEGKNDMIFPRKGPRHFPSIPSPSFARGHACQNGRGFEGSQGGWLVNWVAGFWFETLHVCTLPRHVCISMYSIFHIHVYSCLTFVHIHIRPQYIYIYMYVYLICIYLQYSNKHTYTTEQLFDQSSWTKNCMNWLLCWKSGANQQSPR